MYKYSLIIPVYKCEKYLEECVNSLLVQTINDSYEIILVDDGSPDTSASIARRLSEEHSNIRFYQKKNGGASSARNYGIDRSSGKYLLFIDGDDTVDQDLLLRIDNVLEKDSDSLIVYGMSFDYYRNEIIERTEKLSCHYPGTFTKNQMLELYPRYFDDNMLSSACNKVFSAQIIKEHNLRFNESMTLYEDYDFVLRYLHYVDLGASLDTVFYHYRNNLENVHLYARVADVDKLKVNMSQLMQTSLDYYDSLNDAARINVLNTVADLYMQLLVRHLFAKKYSYKIIKSILSEYISIKEFQDILLAGAQITGNEKILFNQIKYKQFFRIYVDIESKILKSQFKRIIKKILRGLHLYH